MLDVYRAGLFTVPTSSIVQTNTWAVSLVCSSGDTSGVYATKEWLERVIVVGVDKKPTTVTLQTAKGGEAGYVIHQRACVVWYAVSYRYSGPLLCSVLNRRSYAMWALNTGPSVLCWCVSSRPSAILCSKSSSPSAILCSK